MNQNMYVRLGVIALVAAAAGLIVFSKHATNRGRTASNEIVGEFKQAGAESQSTLPALTMDGGVAVPVSGNPTEPLPRLLDLGADKCMPCRMMAPILDKLREEFAGQFDVEFIDVWKERDAASSYEIRVIPTQIFFDPEGRELTRHEGFLSRDDILLTWDQFGYSFVQDTPDESDSDISTGAMAPNANEPDSADDGEEEKSDDALGDTSASSWDWWFEAIYLHPKLRCRECLLAEARVAEILRNQFGDELEMDYLRWRVVDYESPENDELAQSFDVSEGSELVFAQVTSEGIIRWERFPDVLEFGRDSITSIELIENAFETFERSCQKSVNTESGDRR